MEALFTKDGHQYTLDGKKGKSVSAYTAQFRDDFDSEHISRRTVCKDKDYPTYASLLKENNYDEKAVVAEMAKDIPDIDLKALSVRKKWDEKRDKGTIFHDRKEQFYLEQGFKVNPFDKEKYFIPDCVYEKNSREDCDNATPVSDLSKLPPGYYPELLLYDEDEFIVGQADEVYIKKTPSGMLFDIDDYKSDKSIWETSMFSKVKKGFQMFHFPLDHLMDTNKNYYGIKINKYANMLIKKGYKMRNLAFTHVDLNNFNAEGVRYTVPNMQKEIELMKKYYKK